MPKFIMIIEGEPSVIEAKNEAEAEEIAFDTWLQGADQDYSIEAYSKAAAAEYGLAENDDDAGE